MKRGEGNRRLTASNKSTQKQASGLSTGVDWKVVRREIKGGGGRSRESLHLRFDALFAAVAVALIADT
jgi:hypothetical protein